MSDVALISAVFNVIDDARQRMLLERSSAKRSNRRMRMVFVYLDAFIK